MTVDARRHVYMYMLLRKSDPQPVLDFTATNEGRLL